MHDSAYQIGELVMQTYCDLPKAEILEIGSMDVNGSLRDAATSTTRYIGLDLEEGPGVDVVIKPNDKLPFDADRFDLVMASSAFEHDPRFWETFLEMCRVARPGGHVYVNAPSNGVVHRYPMDCWRFYPDAGLAMVAYAQSQGLEIDLVESFVGGRIEVFWNDFTAVFRKGPSKKPMNADFVCLKYPSYNARTWNSDDLLFETPFPEDMQIEETLQQKIAECEERLKATSVEIDAVRENLNHAENQFNQSQRTIHLLETGQAAAERLEQRLTVELRVAEADARHLRSIIESLERQAISLSTAIEAQASASARAEESEKALVGVLRAEIDSREKEVAALSNEIDAQASASARARESDQALVNELRFEIERLEKGNNNSARENEQALAALRSELDRVHLEHLSVIKQTSAELSQLRALAKERDDAASVSAAKAQRHLADSEWLRAVQMVLAAKPLWWSLLPQRSRRVKKYALLSSVGLFDEAAYLARHPDVAAEERDPLDHYIVHGIHEGRDRGLG